MTNEVTVIPPIALPSASSNTAQVCAALATAQAKFDNPKRSKTATVKPRDGGQGYTFDYAPLEEVVKAIKDGLAENGLSRQQYLFRGPDGVYWLRTVLWHSSGEWISGDYPVIYSKESAQGFAGGVTYAKRQGLSLLLGLAAEDDDDGNGADANAATIQPTSQARGPQTRKPREPAPNVMPPHDPQTGEVDEEFEAYDSQLVAAIDSGGSAKMREVWKTFPGHMHTKLQPRVNFYLQRAKAIDEGRKIGQEMGERTR
jgi:hypothetical protein